MAKVNSEITRYDDLVDALSEGLKEGYDRKYIYWDSYKINGLDYSSHSVPVCKTSKKLVELGLLDYMVYEKKHFIANMKDYDVKHGHSATRRDMLMLPNRINNPIAILSENQFNQRYDEQGNSYSALTFILSSEGEGKDVKYYAAGVQPKDFQDGLISFGYASKIITYYKLEASQLSKLLQEVVDRDRTLLYLDEQKYKEIQLKDKPITITQMTPKNTIDGYFEEKSNLDKLRNNHVRLLLTAINQEVRLFLENKEPDRQTNFPLFRKLIKTIKYERENFADVIRARKMLMKMCKLIPHSMIRQQCIDKTDKLFARAYVDVMTPNYRDSLLYDVETQLLAIDVRNEKDLDYLSKVADELCDTYPTLNGLQVVFSDTISKSHVVMEARDLSGRMYNELLETIDNIVAEKRQNLQQLEEQKHETTNQYEWDEQEIE